VHAEDQQYLARCPSSSTIAACRSPEGKKKGRMEATRSPRRRAFRCAARLRGGKKKRKKRKKRGKGGRKREDELADVLNAISQVAGSMIREKKRGKGGEGRKVRPVSYRVVGENYTPCSSMKARS